MKSKTCEDCNSKTEKAFKTLCPCCDVGYNRDVEVVLCQSCYDIKKKMSDKLKTYKV